MNRDMDLIWWWKVLWKLKCPLKAKLLSRFLFSGKALTWDVLIMKGREGPSRCYLCNLEVETNLHIGVECSFTRRVWLEIESKLRLVNLWRGNSFLDYVKNWCLNVEVRYRSLPIIVSWFIWKARNQCWFEDIKSKPYQVSSLCLGLLNSYPMDNRSLNIRLVVEEIIDKESPWGYLDGSAAGVP